MNAMNQWRCWNISRCSFCAHYKANDSPSKDNTAVTQPCYVRTYGCRLHILRLSQTAVQVYFIILCLLLLYYSGIRLTRISRDQKNLFLLKAFCVK
jgi:hypothetical protein